MTYEEILNWIYRSVCTTCAFGRVENCGYYFEPDCAIYKAIKAVKRCQRIDEMEPLYYKDRTNLCEEDKAYEQGYNDCLRIVGGGRL